MECNIYVRRQRSFHRARVGRGASMAAVLFAVRRPIRVGQSPAP